ncbi:hypothetical protein [Neisseria yangbaofengii]|nr:hypothetical protein [Neisseria yangbaofengii]
MSAADNDFPIPQRHDVPTRFLNAETTAAMFHFLPAMGAARCGTNV